MQSHEWTEHDDSEKMSFLYFLSLFLMVNGFDDWKEWLTLKFYLKINWNKIPKWNSMTKLPMQTFKETFFKILAYPDSLHICKRVDMCAWGSGGGGHPFSSS